MSQNGYNGSQRSPHDQEQVYQTADGQIITESQMRAYYDQQQRANEQNTSPDHQNMFSDMTQQQQIQMYSEQEQQYGQEEDPEFHDSRIVRTVRNLKRQNSASKTSLNNGNSGGNLPQPQPQIQLQNQMFSNGGQGGYPQETQLRQMMQTDQHGQYRQGSGTRMELPPPRMGGTQNNIAGNSRLGYQGQTPNAQQQPAFSQLSQNQPMTSYQRRQLEKQQQQQAAASGGQEMSLEDRLNRLKKVHQKIQRPPSGRSQGLQAMRQQQLQNIAPLDPLKFQQELAERTAAEQAQMEQFKKQEERMKAYQENKNRQLQSSRPPLAVQPSTSNLMEESQMTASQKQLIPIPKRNATKTVLTSKVPNQRERKNSKQGLRKNSNMNVNQSQNSKSTSASNNDRINSNDPESFNNAIDSENEENPMPMMRVNQVGEQGFNIQNETGERGAEPDSNKILDDEQTLIRQKKEKCIEIFRNATEIRQILTNSELNPDGYDLTQIIEMLYENQHFLNLLGDMLVKKPATLKLEKFFANQVKGKLKEIRLNRQIEASFSTINQRITQRLIALRNTRFEVPDDLDKENRNA